MSKRILVVDDHDVVRQGVRLILCSHPEWGVVGEAEDGFDALAKIESLDPDLVILDISMPRKDGLEVLAELSEKKVHSRVLVLTAYSDDVDGRFQRDVNGHSGHVNKVGAQRRWDYNHARHLRD